MARFHVDTFVRTALSWIRSVWDEAIFFFAVFLMLSIFAYRRWRGDEDNLT
jgi:hypothetical protein